MPWDKCPYVADISCQCSLCARRKYQAGKSFQLMHGSSVWAKCLEGRNKERLCLGCRTFLLPDVAIGATVFNLMSDTFVNI